MTGFEAQRQKLHSNRATADLPNITNIFDPVIPESSTAGLAFLRDAKHSGDIDQLTATYFSTYSVDQIDVTSRLKIRLSGRKDRWDTDLAPQIFVPGRIYLGNQLVEPGVHYGRNDAPLSGSAAFVYKLVSGLSLFGGNSRSNLATFSSEATQNGVQAPESGLEYEAGLKFSEAHGRVTLTAAAYDIKRNNVFTLVNDEPIFNNQASRGIDANLSLKLTGSWDVMMNGTLRHSVLTSNHSSPSSTGKVPIGVSGYIFNLWSSYGFRVRTVSGFRVSGGLTARDKLYGEHTQYERGAEFYRIGRGPVLYATRLGHFGKMPQSYEYDVLHCANGAGAFVGNPRTYFVQLKVDFEKR